MTARATKKPRAAQRRCQQVTMPWGAPTSRPAQLDATARAGAAKVDFIPRWTPKHVWTLHAVPGRLDGPPLAVKRRCLNQADVSLDFEIARNAVARVYTEDLEEHGVTDARIDCGDYDLDVGLLVYDHKPTAEERAEFMRRKRIERELRRKRLKKVWVAHPAPRLEDPHVAVCFSVCPSRFAGKRFEYEVKTPDWKEPQPGTYVIGWPIVDVADLMATGSQSAHWGARKMNVTVYLERPSADELARLGREHAEEVARDAQHRREARDFAESIGRTWEQAQRQQREQHAALGALGLDAGCSEGDVQRAFRRKIAAEKAHPDQGGDAARFQELTRLRDAALRAVGETS